MEVWSKGNNPNVFEHNESLKWRERYKQDSRVDLQENNRTLSETSQPATD